MDPKEQSGPAQPAAVTSPPAMAAPSASTNHVSAGLVVLQWLTYAFWGWTVLVLSALTSSLIYSLSGGSDSGAFSMYAAAAAVILLPISFVCDSFYLKRETHRKTGAETIVMVIHAVLFALFAIASLITAAFGIVQAALNRGDGQYKLTLVISALIIFVFYALTFLRTLNPASLPLIAKLYRFIMLALVGLLIILSFAGPVRKQFLRRDDTLIENNITTLSTAISDYASQKKMLPASLGELSLKGGAQQIVDKKLVSYKSDESAMNMDSATSSNGLTISTLNLGQPQGYKYQLCAKFKYESPNYRSYGYSDYSKDSEGYSSYISAYSHPAGEVCYKLKAVSYY